MDAKASETEEAAATICARRTSLRQGIRVNAAEELSQSSRTCCQRNDESQGH